MTVADPVADVPAPVASHDPQIDFLLEVFPPFAVGVDGLPLLRDQIAALTPPFDLPPGVVREEYFVPGLNGAPDVRLLVWRPARLTRSAAILHVHGGGTIVGSPEMGEARLVGLALETGCPVVSVDYRLAPETVAPGNVEDCYAALAWLHGRAAEMGFDPNRIAVLGESAGGLLAAGLALMARDRGDHGITWLGLVYPMLDDRTALDTRPGATGRHVWTREANLFGWNCVLGGRCGQDDLPAYAVPARAERLAGLPPTFLAVGALDLFLEEDLAFAARLGREAVPLELHVYPGAFHAFDLAAEADVTTRFQRDLMDALRRGLGD
ncbi:MAG: alpha/beta hydrolase [Sphingobium sp.]